MLDIIVVVTCLNKNELPVMATDIPRIHKWWQQPSPNNDYRPPLPQILCHLFQVICQQMHSHLKMP